jgi:hypothetical protein
MAFLPRALLRNNNPFPPHNLLSCNIINCSLSGRPYMNKISKKNGTTRAQPSVSTFTGLSEWTRRVKDTDRVGERHGSSDTKQTAARATQACASSYHIMQHGTSNRNCHLLCAQPLGSLLLLQHMNRREHGITKGSESMAWLKQCMAHSIEQLPSTASNDTIQCQQHENSRLSNVFGHTHHHGGACGATGRPQRRRFCDSGSC